MTTTDVNELETPTDDAIDWEACWSLASRLGAHTRTLIVDRDYEGAREWALQMARVHGDASPPNGPRAISYFELAVLLGYCANEIHEDARLECDALLAKVSMLQRSVQEKVDAERAALEKAEAEAKAAPEKAEAEAEAAALEAESATEIADQEQQEEVSDDERDGS